MSKKINIAILGASGYTGAELIRILMAHPYARIAALTGDSQAGKTIDEIYPHLAEAGLPRLATIDQTDFSKIDLVFCCLPHGTTQPVIAGLPKQVKIIDLSADFRLKDANEYAKWYGHAHQAVDLQKEAVYGLTEHVRDKIKNARLIANPGCYPTSILLPLLPLLKANAIDKNGIIADSASGVTGAGRSAKQSNLFTEINDGMSVYGVSNHRHTGEIEQELGTMITFTPHLVPMNRGILSTIYVRCKDVKAARNVLEKTYNDEPFVHIIPEGAMPATHTVRGTNACIINIFESRIKGEAIIVSAIDNLVKGASGQAVQNMNVMFGFEETTSLQMRALFP